MLPNSLMAWRVPGWMVGIQTRKREEDFEVLRRRLESENASGAATGTDGGQAEEGRRRTLGRQFLDQFRGSV